jgi:tRNA threonylcarbamoyladenosine biosynthesis protein TsaB
VAGDGGRLYPEAFGPVIEPAYPDARALCEIVTRQLAETGHPELLPPEPLYLRRPDAREPGAPKRVTPVVKPGVTPFVTPGVTPP